jgi:hypothetical protein
MAKQHQEAPKPQQQPPPLGSIQGGPRTVLDAKVVRLALVSYMDENNQQQTALAIVGDKNVHMLESRNLGISKYSTPQGPASEWLRNGVFEKLAKDGE